ncbi:type II toxin-antitoxin system RelE/ParE family toxin [Azospirillum argentinense]|nr:type II toxin-antitoxin system RelE/ParE family toxin [Azospirillum argentinense]MBK3802368.1 hypothetical protein [Azospirillum argentinense]
MKVRYLRGALRNIDDISRYVREHNPAAAVRIAQRIRQSVALIAERPTLASRAFFQARGN